MVGRELVAKLIADGYERVSALTRKECDLEDFNQVRAAFGEIGHVKFRGVISGA